MTNCTPHDINLMLDDGTVVVTLPPGDEPTRCASSFSAVDAVTIAVAAAGIEADFTFNVNEGSYGETSGLPEEHPGVINIVSRIVAEANPDRPDLLMVHDTVRDSDGNIIGCKGFSRLPKTG